MRIAKLAFVASWVLLLFLSAATALLSLQSMYVSYSGISESFGATTTEQLREAGGEPLVKALRARRATASTFSLAFAILSGWVAVVPYRRGERWAWWALLVAGGVPHFLSLGRVIAIGTTLGAAASGTSLAFLLLGLLAGVPKIFRSGEL
ncbi:MAG TPA: hypothetical protein VFV34_05900 [Blastocatellia bacterium]|nr:hypothetical protein [Blastocatellia bacterium]